MRFQTNGLIKRPLPTLKRAGITTFAYTNDAALTFVYDVNTGEIVSSQPSSANAATAPAAQ
jgi:hypothetical protein